MEKFAKETQKTRIFWGKKVLPRIFSSAWETSGMKALTGTLIIAFIIMIASIIAFIFNVVPMHWVDMTVEQVQYDLVTLGCSCVIAIVIIVTLLAYIPTKIYEEYGGFVEKPYELSSERHPDKIVLGDYFRAINVKTTTPFDLEECRLELLEAINIDSGKDVLRRREFLEWSGREGNNTTEPKTIPGKGQFKLCNVSFWSMQDQIAFFALAYDRVRTIPEGIYRLRIEVTGKCKGHTIKEEEQFYLKYQNNIIQLGNKLDMLDNDIKEVKVKSEE